MSKHHEKIKNDPRYKRWAALVVTRAGNACEDCGSADHVQADHVVPLDAGGAPFDPDNGRALCRRCNARKGDRVPHRPEWINREWIGNL